MALFITGLILVLIYGVASLGSRFFHFPYVYDAIAQVATAVSLNPDTLLRIMLFAGAIMLVVGNWLMLMGKVTCDNCGWVGPKRRFIQGCKRCGSHKYH
jgi:predicted membrane-bound mannosyltransferase